MRPQDGDPREDESTEVADFTRDVRRRRLLGRSALGAGLAGAGGALLVPRPAGAADGDPVVGGQTNSGLSTETGLSGNTSPSLLRLAQASTTGDGVVVQMSDSGAAGVGLRVSQAGD